jgi:hypothetical protein
MLNEEEQNTIEGEEEGEEKEDVKDGDVCW